MDLIFSVQPVLVGRDLERLRQNVLHRDNHTCSYCGISSRNGMDVVYSNDSHSTTSEGLATACCVCASVLRGGVHNGASSGFFVLMPEITQQQAIGLFFGMAAWPQIAVTARQQPLRALDDYLQKRRRAVDEYLGHSKSFQASYWRELFEGNKQLEAKRSSLLGPLRFFPDKDSFKVELADWGSELFKKYDETSLAILANKEMR